MKCAALLLLVATLNAFGSEARTPPAEEVRRAVEPRDFFLYGCVREFAKAHSLPEYDTSIGYGVEYGRLTAEEMSRLYDAAKAFALTLPAPDPSDEEHGGVPVVAACLEEARSPRVDVLIQRERKAKE